MLSETLLKLLLGIVHLGLKMDLEVKSFISYECPSCKHAQEKKRRGLDCYLHLFIANEKLSRLRDEWGK